MSWFVIFSASMGVPALLNQGAQGFAGGDGRRASERQVPGFGDNVLRRVGRMAFDPEGKSDGVAAGNRAVLAESVGILDFAK